MSAYLLDGSVLVALYLDDHPHHDRAIQWFASIRPGSRFASCPITEGILLRMHMMHARDRSAHAAWAAIADFRSLDGHEEWLDNFSYAGVPHEHLHGPRQGTDAWLVELARRRGGKVATLDASLATLYPDAVELIPFPF